MFGEMGIVTRKKKIQGKHKQDEDEDEDEDEDKAKVIEKFRKDPDTTVDSEEKSPDPKFLYEMKKLQGWFNPEASRIVESLKSGREKIINQDELTMMMLEGPMEPGSSDEAYNHSDLDSRAIWRSNTDKELKETNVRRVWKKINKSEIPDGRRCVKSKWVFKIKRNGVF
jgi:hypothetical protein